MTEQREPIWTKSFISIAVTQFIVFVAFYTLLTTLPIYVIDNLGKTEAEGGLVVTTILVAAILVRPFSGKILEWIGKKKGLFLSMTAFALVLFLYIWIDQFVPLLILRFIHGLSFGILTTATGAIAADVIPMQRRGEGLGYFAMSMNIAVVVGPFIGLTLLQWIDFRTLFIFLSVFTLLGIWFAGIVSVPEDLEEVETPKKGFTIHDLFEIKAIPIAVISSLVALSYSSVLSFISVYAKSLGLTTAAGYFFLVFAIVMIASRPFLGKLFDSRGPSWVILPCLAVFAIGLYLLSFTDSALLLLLAAGIIGLGYGSLLPSFQTMAVQAAHPKRSSHSTATFYTLYDSGIALGSFSLGLIVTQFGYEKLYLICAGIVVVIIGLFAAFQQRQRKTENVVDTTG
ncbi:MFS transporter [Radiobacillus kanasensis]|uniref:MFS transporter n=1 Tax=Radiobacillus kanasensis TaxID=2844358 RepID=UPI001E461568|nr:MFS transporter [Radiobacillus kanasensis]UFT99696.1 MFS transporter [Radiobacillus kanasensis]